MNNVTIVGKIAKLENNEMVVAVPRPYKNVDGIYETDFITCKMFKSINESTLEYCKIGDVVGVKGRLQSDEDKTMYLVAEKVSFLSTRKEDEE